MPYSERTRRIMHVVIPGAIIIIAGLAFAFMILGIGGE